VNVGILSNPNYPRTRELAKLLQQSLSQRDIESLHSTAEREEREARLPPDLDMLITLGGDGTMLRAAHLRAAEGTPILGIHMGRLGFLAEVPSDEWEQSLDRVCGGDYWLEERAMLCGHLHRGDQMWGPWEALNEIVIGRSGVGHMVQLATFVDDGYFTTYVADGLIVATATGSTAYALSSGGPILPPELSNMVLVPICPHLSLDRTIVLAEGATVTVCVESSGDAAVVVDGTAKASLQAGDRVVLAKSPHVSRFVRLYDRRQVYETLMERLKPREVEKPDGKS
jgi:NAD+ kinase